jgi:hypothetical protein
MADGCEGSQGPIRLQCCGQSECISLSKNVKSVNVSTIPVIVARFPCNTPAMRFMRTNGWTYKGLLTSVARSSITPGTSEFVSSTYFAIISTNFVSNNCNDLALFLSKTILLYPIYFTPSQMTLPILTPPHSTV